MLLFAKRIGWLAVLGLGTQYASAFALLGPEGQAPGTPDGYQQIIISYQLPIDIGTPKNLGEEYRRNTPVMYYTMDANFLDYFGVHGSNAIVQAFEIMNSLTNVSSYSGNLSEFPYAAQEYNFKAQALQLQDLKSVTLNLLVEQMGLAEPDRYTWTLRDRVPGNACPVTAAYSLVQRNFDPVWSTPDQFQSSSYVNGTLYTYLIYDFCNPPPANVADAFEFRVDGLATEFTAVASLFSDFGGFFTGLTRDDVGGLRYLMRTNNMNIEGAGPDTITYITNNLTHQLLFSSNLTQLAQAALTNNAGALNALYPDLFITGTSNYFVNEIATNVIAYFTNVPGTPFGQATLRFTTEFVTNIVQNFTHSFFNVVTNNYYTNSTVLILTTNIGPNACPTGTPFGLSCTNVTAQAVNVPVISGEVFIVPTNACGFSIIRTQLVRVEATTNLILVATNLPGTTNIAGQEFSQSLVNFFTNHILDVHLVVCPINNVELRQGIERIRFERRDFDSWLHRFFYPITNTYTLNAITNNTLFPQRVQRIISAPDFLITAADIGDQDPNNGTLPGAGVLRGITFDNTNVAAAYPGLAGPGTISRLGGIGSTFQGNTFTYDKKGPHFDNFFTGFFFGLGFPFITGEGSQIQFFVWGSFDGTTNLPVVYPNGTSITNLENAILIQVGPASSMLSTGVVGVAYSAQFTVTGGQPPYAWSMAPDSPGLPFGLHLSPAGTISGIPTTEGVFDFVVRLTDAGSRFVDRPYTITINDSP